jgi:hypothetical protein
MAEQSSLEAAKVEAAIGNRIPAEIGLEAGVRASLGRVSRRMPGGAGFFVVTGRGYRMDVLSRMRPEDMVVCDLEGNWVDGPPSSLPHSEVKIHSRLDKNRPDVRPVVHVHPDDVVLMSVLEQRITPMAQEGIGLVFKPLPLYRRTKIITSEEEGQEVARLLGDTAPARSCLVCKGSIPEWPKSSLKENNDVRHRAGAHRTAGQEPRREHRILCEVCADADETLPFAVCGGDAASARACGARAAAVGAAISVPRGAASPAPGARGLRPRVANAQRFKATCSDKPITAPHRGIGGDIIS